MARHGDSFRKDIRNSGLYSIGDRIYHKPMDTFDPGAEHVGLHPAFDEGSRGSLRVPVALRIHPSPGTTRRARCFEEAAAAEIDSVWSAEKALETIRVG